MKTTFVKTTTEDKLVLHGLLFTPETSTKKAVVSIHGMAGNFYVNEFLHHQAKEFTENNWAFLSTNNRGVEHITEAIIKNDDKEEYKLIGVHNEKFSNSQIDIKAWVDYISSLGYEEIILQGHSLGACKIVYYLTQTNDSRIKKLILLAAPDMIALNEKWEGHQETLREASLMAKEGRGDQLVSKRLDNWYYLTANTYLDFGTRGNPIDIFNFYNPAAPSMLSEVKVPFLACYGDKDEAPNVPVTEALELIRQKASNTPEFNSIIIGNTGHSFLGQETEMAKKVTEWLIK